MSQGSYLELAIAVVVAGLGVWLYRRPSPEPDHYGSQGAVLLFAIAAILVVHVVMSERASPHVAEVEVVANDA